jgi:hypothetical protein
MNNPSKTQLWIGRVMSAVAVLFFLFDGVTKLLRLPPVVEATMRLGYPESSILVIGVIVLACTALYATPATAALGAVLLTGFLGGATATNLRVGSPLFSHTLFPAYIGALLWAGLLLRRPQLRVVIPGAVAERM